jgi:hypothetical protein
VPAGYIYILSNSAMPGLLKIGRTDRHPEQRARELHTTGVPHPFVLEHFIDVEDSAHAEAEIHRLLQGKGTRATTDREFFSISLHEAIEALELVSLAMPQASDFSRAGQFAQLAQAIRTPRQGSGFDEYEVAANKLAALARRGYPSAMREAANFFELSCPSGPHFKLFWREYLELARAHAIWHPLASANGKEHRASVGRETAEYVYCCFRHGWLIENDFEFISSFLIQGDQFQFEGYMSELDRYQLPEAVMSKARNV